MSRCIPIEQLVGKTIKSVEWISEEGRLDSAVLYFTDGSTLYVDYPTAYVGRGKA